MTDDDEALLKSMYGRLRHLAGIIAPLGVVPDDLVQETFLRVVERGGFDGVDSPFHYTRRVLVNLATNERKRLMVAQRALQRHGITSEESAASYPSDLAELMRIAPRSRLLVYLVDVLGETVAEAAVVAGCTEGGGAYAAFAGATTIEIFVGGS